VSAELRAGRKSRKREGIVSMRKITAGAVLAEIPHWDRFESAKAIAAFAGCRRGIGDRELPFMAAHGFVRPATLACASRSTCRRSSLFGSIPFLKSLPIASRRPGSTGG
jgi:hypothetical protein